jgi:hypothetical protein
MISQRIIQFLDFLHIRVFRKTTSPIILGRWNNNQTYNQMNKKIDWSNHDHCGPCGNITIKKVQLPKPVKSSNH